MMELELTLTLIAFPRLCCSSSQTINLVPPTTSPLPLPPLFCPSPPPFVIHHVLLEEEEETKEETKEEQRPQWLPRKKLMK